jgi:hypothetical protein
MVPEVNDLRHRRVMPNSDNTLTGAAAPVSADQSGPQPRTTACERGSCAQCGRALTGRKEKFCSDACRMRNCRIEHQAELAQLFQDLTRTVEMLREKVLTGAEARDVD